MARIFHLIDVMNRQHQHKTLWMASRSSANCQKPFSDYRTLLTVLALCCPLGFTTLAWADQQCLRIVPSAKSAISGSGKKITLSIFSPRKRKELPRLWASIGEISAVKESESTPLSSQLHSTLESKSGFGFDHWRIQRLRAWFDNSDHPSESHHHQNR